MGSFEGLAVGVREGALEALRVGTLVGVVRTSEERIVGFAEGNCEGHIVGMALGATVEN